MMKNIRFPYAPAFAWGIFVFALSVWPGKDFPSIPDWGDLLSLDKIVHMVFYGLLNWLILYGKQQHKLSVLVAISWTFGIISTAFSSGYGWFLEWFQGAYCEDRMSDVMDGIANTIGAVLSLLIFFFLQRKNLSNKNA